MMMGDDLTTKDTKDTKIPPNGSEEWYQMLADETDKVHSQIVNGENLSEIFSYLREKIGLSDIENFWFWVYCDAVKMSHEDGWDLVCEQSLEIEAYNEKLHSIIELLEELGLDTSYSVSDMQNIRQSLGNPQRTDLWMDVVRDVLNRAKPKDGVENVVTDPPLNLPPLQQGETCGARHSSLPTGWWNRR